VVFVVAHVDAQSELWAPLVVEAIGLPAPFDEAMAAALGQRLERGFSTVAGECRRQRIPLEEELRRRVRRQVEAACGVRPRVAVRVVPKGQAVAASRDAQSDALEQAELVEVAE
jgi:hypothetical protein